MILIVNEYFKNQGLLTYFYYLRILSIKVIKVKQIF